MPSVKIRPMTATDIPAVVSVHRTAFSGFFLDSMGPAFLRGYYSSVLDYEGSVSLIGENEAGVPNGFVVGFVDPGGFYRHFRARRTRLLPAILIALLRRPWLILGILRNRTRVSQAACDLGDDRRIAELSSIATTVRGGGVGSALLLAFVEEMRRRECTEIGLTTDADGNDTVRSFYERHGFVETGREQRGRRQLISYTLRFAESSSDCSGAP